MSETSRKWSLLSAKLLLITRTMVAPEHHRTVWMGFFSFYLNKVNIITTEYSQRFLAWMKGACFDIYAWNALPIDKTKIIYPFAAKVITFLLNINLALKHTPRLEVL